VAGTEGDVTIDQAVANAARILQDCEMEIDLAKMERLTDLANCWARIAELLAERENA